MSLHSESLPHYLSSCAGQENISPCAAEAALPKGARADRGAQRQNKHRLQQPQRGARDECSALRRQHLRCAQRRPQPRGPLPTEDADSTSGSSQQSAQGTCCWACGSLHDMRLFLAWAPRCMHAQEEPTAPVLGL